MARKYFNDLDSFYHTCYDWKDPETVACADISRDYETDEVCIIKDDGKFHVVSCSGCSCIGAGDGQYDDGPFDTYKEALAAAAYLNKKICDECDGSGRYFDPSHGANKICRNCG
jgi:hypothetical protein